MVDFSEHKKLFALLIALSFALIISWFFYSLSLCFESLPFVNNIINCFGMLLAVWLIVHVLEKYPLQGIDKFLKSEEKHKCILRCVSPSQFFLGKIVRLFSPRTYIFDLLQYPFSNDLYINKSFYWHLTRMFCVVFKTIFWVGACLVLVHLFDVDTFNLVAILGIMPLLAVSFFCPIIFGAFFVLKTLFGGIIAKFVLNKGVNFNRAMIPVFFKSYTFCFIQGGLLLILFTLVFTPAYFYNNEVATLSNIIRNNLIGLLALFMFALVWLKLIKPIKVFLRISGISLVVAVALGFSLFIIHYPAVSLYFQPYINHFSSINYPEMQREYFNAINPVYSGG